MENVNKSLNEDDKTIIYSTSKNTTIEDSTDKTVVNDNSEKTHVESPNPSKHQDPGNKSTSSNQNFSDAEKMNSFKGKEDKSSVSPATAAAGVVAAGMAGTAVGTIYSDEIKGVFANKEIEDPELAAKKDDHIVSASKNSNDSLLHNPDNDLKNDVSSVLELSTKDDQGNQYNVSLVDVDNDGKIDYQTAHIDFVDGSSISYTAAGDNMDSLFDNKMNIATNEDHANLQQVSNAFESGDTSIYEIQAGDTLSEIALTNDTSVSELMEINPSIQDPDLIYAGDEIHIPNNENTETSNDDVYLTGSYATETEIESVSSDQDYSEEVSSSVDEIVGEETSNYEEELSNSDFDNFDSPDSHDFEPDFPETNL